MFTCEFDMGFQKKEKGKFEINPMKKQRFIIWVSLLIAILIGAAGWQDQGCCFEVDRCCNPLNTTCCPPSTSQTPSRCGGCSDIPVVDGVIRSGHFRTPRASSGIPQPVQVDFLSVTALPISGPSGGFFPLGPSPVLNSFAFLRTVILLI